PPVVSFDHYTNYGANVWGGDVRPTYIANDTLSWVKGRHTFRFGGECRGQGLNNWGYPNHSGTFYFSDLNTGLQGIRSGNAMASFLLGYVATGTAQLTTVTNVYARAKYYGLHLGDTFKATSKLTV